MKNIAQRDTGVAKLPGLPAVNAQDPALRNWINAVSERLEVREGSRGNPWERAVTIREIKDILEVTDKLKEPKKSDDRSVSIDLGGGLSASVAIDRFVESIKATRLYRDLMKRLDDPTRFDDVVKDVRDILLRSIADEAAKRGADIRRMETVIQDANRSLAYTVEEITAALGANAAGVREVTWAFADASQAQAGKITQLEASLGNYYADGTSGRVALEQQLGVFGDRVDGLAGEYMVKINAGKAAAGFGLAASEDPTGATTSAFIVQADKFAVVTGGDVIADYNNPPANRIPFGVDASGVYINGQLRVNADGDTLEDLATTPGPAGPAGPAGAAGAAGQSISVVATSQVFAIDNSGTVTPSSIICSVRRPPALAGSAVDGDFVWTLVSGSCSQSLTTINSSSGAFGSLSVNEITTDSATFRCVYTVSTPGSAYLGMSYTDEITITKVKQGVGVSTFLTNESHTVPASTEGVVSDWTGAGGTFKVYSGTTDVTSSSTFAIVANPSALTASIGASSGVFAVTGAGSWASGSSLTTLTLRATYIHPVTGSATYDKVFTLSKSKAGAAGAAGASGASGVRGSLTLYASGSSWTDAVANSAILSASGSSTKVIGDTVTISNGTSFAATKYWSGTAWVSPGVVINGNLLVNGSVSAGKIDTRGLTIKDAAGQVIFGSGTALSTSYISGLGGLASQNVVGTNQVSGLGALATQNSVAYSSVTGAKPPTNADNTASNTAAAIANQGTLATRNGVAIGTNVTFPDGSLMNTTDFVNRLSKINDTNISTFMSAAAIGNAYIGNAAVSTLKIAGNAVTVASGSSGGYSAGVTVSYPEAAKVIVMGTFTQGTGKNLHGWRLSVNGFLLQLEAPIEGTTGAMSRTIDVTAGSHYFQISCDQTTGYGACGIAVMGAMR